MRPVAARANSFARFQVFPERPERRPSAVSYEGYHDDDTAETTAPMSFEPMEPMDVESPEENVQLDENHAVAQNGPDQMLTPADAVADDNIADHHTTELSTAPAAEQTGTISETVDAVNDTTPHTELTDQLDHEEHGLETELDAEQVMSGNSTGDADTEPTVQSTIEDTPPSQNNDSVRAAESSHFDNLQMMAPEPEHFESYSDSYPRASIELSPTATTAASALTIEIPSSPTEEDIQQLSATLSSPLDTSLPSYFKRRTPSNSSRTSIPRIDEDDGRQHEVTQAESTIPENESPPASLLDPTLDIRLSPQTTPLLTPSESPLRTPQRATSPLRQALLSPSKIPRSMSPSSSNMEIRPFEKRFETRIGSLLRRTNGSGGHSRSHSGVGSTGSGSPHGIHSRSSSQQLSFALAANQDLLSGDETMSWAKLHNISNHIYSEAGQMEHGEPSALLVTNTICIGTKRGTTLVFDYQQNLKKALAYVESPVTCLAVSSDATFLAVGHASGHVITWDLSSLKHDLVIKPQVAGAAVLHIAFVGKRHSCLVSGDSMGKAYLHDGYTGITGRKTRSGCILGQSGPSPGKPTTMFACSSLPLGSVSSYTDELGLVAIMTPHILAIISTTPTVLTQFKIGRPKNINPTLGFIGTLAWYPAVRSSTSVVGSDRPVLAYSWANVVTIMEVNEGSGSGFAKSLKFTSIGRHVASETIVSIQWINRQVLALITSTQNLLVVNVADFQVSATVDLLSKHVLKFDNYSSAIADLRIGQTSDDDGVPAVPLDSYASSVCAFKGRVFLLGCYELVVGYTLTWHDKVEILIKRQQYLSAIKLALAYYDNSSPDAVVVGLPVDEGLRRAMLKPAIHEIIANVLPKALVGHLSPLDEAELTSIVIDAVIDTDLGDTTVENSLYDLFEDAGKTSLYLDTLANAVFDLRLRSVSPRVFKGLVSSYSEDTEKMEEIICTLDPATLDVDTTLNLCRQHRLLDASVYIWNVALNDYISPLSEFLTMIVDGEGVSEEAVRVYSYLSYIFSGRVYPSGLRMATPQKEIEAKSSLYYVLLIGNFIVWPKVGGRKIPSLVDSDHYPYLKSLITFNPASFYVALDEAFEDHFLNDNVDMEPDEGRQDIDQHFFGRQPPVPAAIQSGRSSPFNEEVSFGTSVNRQMVVDVLLQIAPELSPECHIYTFIFIARNYPKYSQFIMLGEGILKSILEFLCVTPTSPEIREQCELAVEVLISKFRPFDLQWTVSLLGEAGYNGALSYVYRSERMFPKLVEHCFSRELYRDIFDTIEKSFEETSGSSQKLLKDRQKIEDSVRTHFSQLIRLSPSRTVSLVSEWCPKQHTVVLELDEEYARDQLMYLKSYFQSLRVGGGQSPSSPFWLFYITLLAKLESPESVIDQLDTEVSSLTFDLDIEQLIPVLEATGNVESVILLLQRKKRPSEALDYLLKELARDESNLHHLVKVGARVCGKDEALWEKLLSGLESEEAVSEGFKQLSSDLVSGDGRLYRLVHKILLNQETSSTSAKVVKSVVLGVSDNYKFKIRFLELTKKILDSNTYSLMMRDLEKQRLRGWKVGSCQCDACGKTICGKGVNGALLYKAWQEAKTKGTGRKLVFKNKGKESCDGDRIYGGQTDRIVVFRCGHVFHLGCMNRLGMVDEIACLICESTKE